MLDILEFSLKGRLGLARDGDRLVFTNDEINPCTGETQKIDLCVTNLETLEGLSSRYYGAKYRVVVTAEPVE